MLGLVTFCVGGKGIHNHTTSLKTNKQFFPNNIHNLEEVQRPCLLQRLDQEVCACMLCRILTFLNDDTLHKVTQARLQPHCITENKSIDLVHKYHCASV